MAKTVTVRLNQTDGNIRVPQNVNITLGGAPGIQGQQGPVGDSGQPSNRYAFVLDTTSSLNPPYFPRVSASFNGEDLALAYLTTLGTGSATPYKIISELKPADQSSIDRNALMQQGIYVSRIDDPVYLKQEYIATLSVDPGTLSVTEKLNTLNFNVTCSRVNTGIIEISNTESAFTVNKTHVSVPSTVVDYDLNVLHPVVVTWVNSGLIRINVNDIFLDNLYSYSAYGVHSSANESFSFDIHITILQ